MVISLFSSFGALFLRHGGQTLDFLKVQFQIFRNAGAIIAIGLVKNSGLAHLNPFLGTAQVADDVADEMITVLLGHDFSV